MKIKIIKYGMIIVVTLIICLFIDQPMSLAFGTISSVEISVDTSDYKEINKAKNVGVNIEMSTISDELWNENGKWLEETFDASGLKIMRWGYDAWVWDWQEEVPLQPDKYWGGYNTKDAAGTFGLYEFIEYCKKYDVIPFVDIPIEAHDWANPNSGSVTLQKVKDLTRDMADYMNSQGITMAYFDMGNEPWSTGSNMFGEIPADYYGDLFSEFQPLIKNANPNYKLVLQHAPERWYPNWNETAENHAAGFFDAYDDHQYVFYDWDKYYNKDDDSFYSPGRMISGVESLLGECNVGWTPQENNWDAGHVNDLGGGLVLLNALLDVVNMDSYDQIVTWPSHFPSGDIGLGPQNPFGWFNLDKWYTSKKTERFTGPMLAHMIINQNVLDNKIGTISSSPKVRTFAYTDKENSVLKIIAINKLDSSVDTSLNLPTPYSHVNATIMKGDSLTDRNPVYVNHLPSNTLVNGTTFMDNLPAQCAVVYTFYNDNTTSVPEEFHLLSPESEEMNVSTAKNFKWTPSEGAYSYRLIVATDSNFSDVVLDINVGNHTSYQTMKDFVYNQQYYWKVMAINKNGTNQASNNGISFTTPPVPLRWNDDNNRISYSPNWNDQTYWGAYNSDDHSSKTAGDYVEFTFTGTQAKLYGVKGFWCGKADIQIDDGAIMTIDTYQSGAQQVQALLYDSGELEKGNHTVKLTVRGDKNEASSDCWIEFDYVEIETNTWNDDHPNIFHSENWNDQTYVGCYSDDNHSSKITGEYVEFMFTGTQAKIYGVKGYWCGKADIEIDGIKVTTIDTYAPEPEQYQALLYDTGILSYGNHRIRLIVTGDKNPSSSDCWIEFDKVEWE